MMSAVLVVWIKTKEVRNAKMKWRRWISRLWRIEWRVRSVVG